MKVRQGDSWESAEILAVINIGPRYFYKVGMLANYMEHILPSNSINLCLQNENKKQRRDSTCLFPGVFLEEPQLPPLNDGYNIEELLW